MNFKAESEISNSKLKDSVNEEKSKNSKKRRSISQRDMLPNNIENLKIAEVMDSLDISSEDDDDEDLINIKKSGSFVGTAEYVSPEVLLDKNISHEADLWALGCIIYKMIACVSPFKDKTEYLTFKRVLAGDFNFKEEIFENEELFHAKDLISNLLNLNPEQRLGSCSLGEINDFQKLKKHPFFSNLDFNKIEILNKNSFVKKSSKNLEYLETQKERLKTIFTIKQGTIEKKSPWFHYNTRKVILDSSPKLEYVDPIKNIVKVNNLT